MRLGDRGGGDGRLEAGVEAVEGPLKGALNLRLGDLRRERRQGVLQAAEVDGEGCAENIRAGGKKLAELDRHGAELLERPRQPFTGAPLACAAAG